MNRLNLAPDRVDVETPTATRVYDYLLGGDHHFAVDRRAARQLLSVMPDIAVQVRANRAFLGRAVRYLTGAGIDQFLDIGSGVPIAGSVHEVAQRANPAARVVYVDHDPLAVVHSRAILAGNDRATIVQADLRQPEAIIHHPELADLLDFTRPVAVLMLAVLHAVPDRADPYRIVGRLLAELVPGSQLAISHPTADSRPGMWAALGQIAAEAGYPITSRGRGEVARFFEGLELADPGLVWLPQWRPADPAAEPERSSLYAAVARKP